MADDNNNNQRSDNPGEDAGIGGLVDDVVNLGRQPDSSDVKQLTLEAMFLEKWAIADYDLGSSLGPVGVVLAGKLGL
ncbi:hypothetical protein PG993_005442 [Apiospora rasikravindrae]|uniref:Uncharacterized protein n=1 Tax=Apiospora rasikravindrae TaxID=990691 RepID=A0ABR1TFK5_9PEZI